MGLRPINVGKKGTRPIFSSGWEPNPNPNPNPNPSPGGGGGGGDGRKPPPRWDNKTFGSPGSSGRLLDPDPHLTDKCLAKAWGRYQEEWAWELAGKLPRIGESDTPPQPSQDACENMGLILAHWHINSGAKQPVTDGGQFLILVGKHKASTQSEDQDPIQNLRDEVRRSMENTKDRL